MTTWTFWKAVLIRAAHTAAQTALGMIVVGAAVEDIDWLRALSVTAVATLVSILKSVAYGVPEVESNEPDNKDC